MTEEHDTRAVIVVDDNGDSAESLAMLLQIYGHAVQTATTGSRALELAQPTPPDVFVIDLGMPRMDGLELARRIRAEPWGGAVVLMAMTGWSRVEDPQPSIDAGFDYHLVKPVPIETLRAIIQKHA